MLSYLWSVRSKKCTIQLPKLHLSDRNDKPKSLEKRINIISKKPSIAFFLLSYKYVLAQVNRLKESNYLSKDSPMISCLSITEEDEFEEEEEVEEGGVIFDDTRACNFCTCRINERFATSRLPTFFFKTEFSDA